MKCLVIGGTGSLGTALIERLAESNQVTCFSRGELGQKTLAGRFPSVRMVLGDVRDLDAVKSAMTGHDTVFLLAAIKHIDQAERNPLEAIKTNVLGAVNVGQAALQLGAKHVVYSNTDKAVLPVSVYGYTKAMAQDYLLRQNGGKTKFSAFVWGNVLASRGSVIQTFVEKLLKHDVVPLTDPRMSRFWLTIDQAADFMLGAYVDAPTDKAKIPPVKGATVVRLVESLARILQVDNYVLGNVGHRGVEKLHEVLESTHEGCFRSDTCDQYTDDELDHLLAPIARRLAVDFEKPTDRRKQGNDGSPLRRDLQPPQSGASRNRPRRPLATA